ncbi:MAG: diphosphomevalonate decarboxylase [Myxococcota bacterium]|nr:diphosphomevalonate decarboxylase [Myxococcota bacterium]
MSKAIACAHANVALIKYWGKSNEALKIPAAGSISLTLDALTTRTEVSFSGDLEGDRMEFDGKRSDLPPGAKTIVELVRTQSGLSAALQIKSTNDFPTAAGLASSASGMAALALAASKAAGLDLDATQLSVLARRGSASAARSVFGGFVEMQSDKDSSDANAYAKELASSAHWALEVMIAVTSQKEKKISSSQGMRLSAEKSSYYQAWVDGQDKALKLARQAIAEKDFQKLADVAQLNTLKMHGLMLATPPGLVYWNATTVSCMHALQELQESGVAVFFSIDAGPQIKAVCLPEASLQVQETLQSIAGVEKVIPSGLGQGAWLE